MDKLGGILFFNQYGSHYQDKTQVRGRGNQHDENNDVDFKMSDSFLKNGGNNYFPFEIESVVKRSMIQRRAHKTITSIVNGTWVFQNDDNTAVDPNRRAEIVSLYNSINLTKKGVIKDVINSNYLQGGSFVTLSYASDGFAMGLSGVNHRKYKTGRLGVPVWFDGNEVIPIHFYHRNWGYHYGGRRKNVKASKSSLDWMEWNKDPEKNFDSVCWVRSYSEELDIRKPINRLQSYLIGDMDGMSDYYPLPCWFSGTAYNYEKAEFLLSCFDIDDIQNGLHASGIVKVYHTSYVDPESAEAIETFDTHKSMVEAKLRGAWNSGAVAVIPVAISPDGKEVPTNDYMQFEEFKTNNNKDRHETFDKRIMNKVLGANGVIMPELLGIRDEKSTLSESGSKLMNAVKLLNQFTIKPQKELVEDFMNDVINPQLGIEEKFIIAPNLKAFANISDELMKHFLHPEMWYDMFEDFGISRPTVEQIESQLIPAYVTRGSSMNRVTIE